MCSTYALSDDIFHSNLRLLVNVHLPKDRISMAHQGYGFSEFLTEEDAEYACKIMNQIKLWGKPIRVNKVRCYSSELRKSLSLSIDADGQVSRPLRIKSNWMLEQICSLEIWMRMSTNDYYTTPSALLELWQRLQRYGGFL